MRKNYICVNSKKEPRNFSNNMKNFISLLLKNLLHPAGIIGLVIALAIPFLIYLGPNVGHKDTIRILDLNLPLPLFMVQLVE